MAAWRLARASLPGSGETPARSRGLAWALALSLGLHAWLMAVRFVAPDPARFTPVDSSLEVVLLNATDRTEPLKPDVLAQASMQGGGDHEQGRARSPLPAETQAVDGDTLMRQQARVEQAEARQSRLLSQARAPEGVDEVPEPAQAEGGDGAEAPDALRTIARLQAQIARNIQDYNKRPRRLTYGINAVGVPFARYVDAWAARVERIGTLRYPPQARGRLYDSLVVLVEVDRHGNVVDVRIPQKSRHEALNQAAREIVLAGQPYDRFTPEMTRQGDILQIVRTWTFTNGALETEGTR